MPKELKIMQDPNPQQKDVRDLNLKYPHLASALSAILLALGAIAYGIVYAQSLEQKYIHTLAPLMLPQANIGSALQEAGFQQSDLLMVYGSSELLVENQTMYGAPQFFQYYPTGFDVYEIANVADTSLNIAQDLAAIGPKLRGRKVVFSFTPAMFIKQLDPLAYAGNFSLLHANALIFNSYLNLETKRIAAQRMYHYPDTLDDDLVLQFAVQELNCGCWYGSYLYDLTVPLGQLDTWIIQLQDHWEILNYIWRHPKSSLQVIRKSRQIDWSKQIAQALIIQKIYSNNNPYGIDNRNWKIKYSQILTTPKAPGSADPEFIQMLNDSKEWTDFDLSLQVLKELGAQPLILSRPLDGPVLDAMGISWQARREFYVKLQNTVAPYGFPLVDFVNYDSDRYFSLDEGSHTSREGWVYVDMNLDAFFHGQIH